MYARSQARSILSQMLRAALQMLIFHTQTRTTESSTPCLSTILYKSRSIYPWYLRSGLVIRQTYGGYSYNSKFRSIAPLGQMQLHCHLRSAPHFRLTLIFTWLYIQIAIKSLSCTLCLFKKTLTNSQHLTSLGLSTT